MCTIKQEPNRSLHPPDAPPGMRAGRGADNRHAFLFSGLQRFLKTSDLTRLCPARPSRWYNETTAPTLCISMHRFDHNGLVEPRIMLEERSHP
jgi:hypothetical protein